MPDLSCESSTAPAAWISNQTGLQSAFLSRMNAVENSGEEETAPEQ